MQHYKIIVAYDGTGYMGWQRQPEMRTIAGTLEHAFQKVFGHEIKLRAASRTDAGVHARGQVAAFETPLDVDPCKMLTARLSHWMYIVRSRFDCAFQRLIFA